MTKNIRLILIISSMLMFGVGITGCDIDDSEIATTTGVATTSPINNIIENGTKIDETTTTTPTTDNKNSVEIKENNLPKDAEKEAIFDEGTTTQGATISPIATTTNPAIATSTITTNEQELANLGALGIAPLPNNNPVFYDKKVENEIAQKINQFRKENGLDQLNNNEQLREVARYKSNTLIQFGFDSEESKLKTNYLVKNVFKVPISWCGEANGGGVGPEMATAEELYNLFITYPGAPEMVLKGTELGVGVAISKEELPLNVEGIDKTSYTRYTMYVTYYVSEM